MFKGGQMHIEAQYRIEDFLKARAVASIPQTKELPKSKMVTILLIMMFLAATGIAGAFFASQKREKLVEIVLYTVASASAPAMMLVVVLLIFLRWQRYLKERPHLRYVEPISSIWGWLLFAMMCISGLALLTSDPARYPSGPFTILQEHWTMSIFFAGTAVVVAGICCIAWRLRLWRIGTTISRLQNVRIIITNEDVVYDTGIDKSQQKWSMFTRFVESPDLFLLFTSEHNYQILPKRCMTPLEVTELRSILLERLPVNSPALSDHAIE